MKHQKSKHRKKPVSLPDPNDAPFNRGVDFFVAKGMHTARGLSEGEYRAICWKEWCTQEADEGEYKVLMDYLLNKEEYFLSARYDYQQPDLLARLSDRDTEDRIECMVAVMLDEFGQRSIEGRPTKPPSEKQPYAVALFDVLGFKALVSENSLESIYERYERLLNEEIEIGDLSTCQTVGPFLSLGTLRHQYAYFSDTILLWTPLERENARAFVWRCCRLVAAGLQVGLPLRGAIALGEAILDKGRMILVGEPIAEAHALEGAQEWIGASFCPSAMWPNWVAEMHPHDVMPYEAPLKSGVNRSEVCGGLVLDWTRHLRDGEDAHHIVTKLAGSELLEPREHWTSVGWKYSNTLDFLKSSHEWHQTIIEQHIAAFSSEADAGRKTLSAQESAEMAFGLRMSEASHAGTQVLWAMTAHGFATEVPSGALQWCNDVGLLRNKDGSPIGEIAPVLEELCQLSLVLGSEPGKSLFRDSYRCHLVVSSLLRATPLEGSEPEYELQTAYSEFYARNASHWKMQSGKNAKMNYEFHSMRSAEFMLESGKASAVGSFIEFLWSLRTKSVLESYVERLKPATEKSRSEQDRWRFLDALAVAHGQLGNFETAVEQYDAALALAANDDAEANIILNHRERLLRKMRKVRRLAL